MREYVETVTGSMNFHTCHSTAKCSEELDAFDQLCQSYGYPYIRGPCRYRNHGWSGQRYSLLLIVVSF
jgi:hypothetical protein